jgi:hypothetical protein
MSPEDIGNEIDRLSDQVDKGHSNVIASAGQELPEDLADKADKIYLNPESSLYAYGNKPPAIAKAKDAPTQTGGGGGGGKTLSTDDLAQAKTLMSQHGRDWVLKYLQGKGYDTSGL